MAEAEPARRFAKAVAQAEAAGRDLPADGIPAALGELERVKAALLLRAVVPPAPDPEERLLTAEQAAERLGITVAALYRRRWPFRVEVSPGRTRYSSAGIDRFIRSRLGR
jgi:hypothetical protein